MENIPKKQLIKTAFGTAPIMALMLVTPLFLLTNGINNKFNFGVAWFFVTAVITIAWILNIVILIRVKQKWVRTWKRVVFVVGGSYGVSTSVKESADILLAFSKFTFTHQMVRIFMVEQLYRAMTIIKNEKYHHE